MFNPAAWAQNIKLRKLGRKLFPSIKRDWDTRKLPRNWMKILTQLPQSSGNTKSLEQSRIYLEKEEKDQLPIGLIEA